MELNEQEQWQPESTPSHSGEIPKGRLSEQEREYFDAVKSAPLPLVADFLRVTCPECDRKIADVRGEIGKDDFREEHTMIGPFVVIGCEGYLMITPLAVGLTSSIWIKIADEFKEMPPYALD